MNDENNVLVEPKKGKKVGLTIGIIVLVLLVVGGLFYFLGASKSAKDIFVTSVDKVYQNSVKNLDKKIPDTMGGSFAMTTDIKSDDEASKEIIDILNSLNINFDYKVDYKNKLMNVLIDSKYKNKDLISATMDIKNNNAYIYLKDIYSKYLVTSVEGIDEVFNTKDNMDDYKTVLKNVKDALNKSFKDGYFKSENATITINNKDTEVVKNILTINDDNYKDITKSIGESLNNDDFIESLSKLTTNTEEEITEVLESLINNEENLGAEITISIFTRGITNDFKGLEVNTPDGSISIIKNTDINYSYNFNINGEEYIGDFDIEIKDNDVNLKINFDILGINGSINIKTTYTEDVKFDEIDTANAVEIEKLSEADQSEIMNNLSKNEGILELMQMFMIN